MIVDQTPVMKTIEIKIINQSGEVVYHQSEITFGFPPAFVGAVIEKVCVCELDDDDHGDLNNLHVMGNMSSRRFGKDWEFTVSAVVVYPKSVGVADGDMHAMSLAYKNTL
jgi:hypothetical protein